MTEQNKSHCKQCNQLKERIQDGFYFDGKNKRWRDETGRLWSGRICPDCNKSRAKDTMAKTRAKRKEIRTLEKTIESIKNS